MPQVVETASFRSDDVDCLVAASLACPSCLSGEVDWRLGMTPWDGWVDCRCTRCGHERRVYLAPDQALRLSLHEARPLDPVPHPGIGDVPL
ncbi:MAG: hypothetical protein IRZ21_04760 [Thermoleophilaceae bacterium]|nr:hypothetical protein [Thermoleophilaceae bacterium]